MITKFVTAITEHRQPVIFGDGEQTRDFVHVDDVCSAFLRSIETQGSSLPINIASGKEIAVIELLRKMYGIAGRQPNPKFFATRKGEIERSIADIKLAGSRLGFSPKIPLEQGLAELIG